MFLVDLFRYLMMKVKKKTLQKSYIHPDKLCSLDKEKKYFSCVLYSLETSFLFTGLSQLKVYGQFASDIKGERYREKAS